MLNNAELILNTIYYNFSLFLFNFFVISKHFIVNYVVVYYELFGYGCVFSRQLQGDL